MTETTETSQASTESVEEPSTFKEFVAENPPPGKEPPLFRYPDPITYTPLPTYNIMHKWKVTGVRTATNNLVRNAIIEVYWQIIGSDEFGNEGTYNGSTQFDLPFKDTGNLIPYDDLSEGEIIGWVKGKLGDRFMDHVNSQILLDINMKKSDVKEPKLPWEK